LIKVRLDRNPFRSLLTLHLIDDPARIQAIARKRARATMMSVRQKASEFDQARREANAAAALLEMESGGKFGGGTAEADELGLQTGLKDRKSSPYPRKVPAVDAWIPQWTQMSSTSRIQLFSPRPLSNNPVCCRRR